jgi:hypothetical protein
MQFLNTEELQWPAIQLESVTWKGCQDHSGVRTPPGVCAICCNKRYDLLSVAILTSPGTNSVSSTMSTRAPSQGYRGQSVAYTTHAMLRLIMSKTIWLLPSLCQLWHFRGVTFTFHTLTYNGGVTHESKRESLSVSLERRSFTCNYHQKLTHQDHG